MSGWIALHRSEETRELLAAYPHALYLLVIIAERARWKSPVIPDGLEKGQALVGKGDFERCGLTEKQYRNAKKVLERAKLCSFAPAKGTARPGTCATLLDARVFSLSEDERGEAKGDPGANPGRSEGEPRATPGRQTNKANKEQDGKNTEQDSPVGLSDFVEFGVGKNLTRRFCRDLYQQLSAAGWKSQGKPLKNWQAYLVKAGKKAQAFEPSFRGEIVGDFSDAGEGEPVPAATLSTDYVEIEMRRRAKEAGQ